MQTNISSPRGHAASGSSGVVVAAVVLAPLDELLWELDPSEPVASDFFLSLPPLSTTKPTTTATTTAAASSTNASARFPRREGMSIACGALGSHEGGWPAATGGGGGSTGGGGAGGAGGGGAA